MNAILWVVGISLASFFGALIYMTRNPPGRWNFLSWFRRDKQEFPIVAHLTPPELLALAACGIAMPPRRGYIAKGSDIFIIGMTVLEMQRLYAATMEAAQSRIARAAAKARRGNGGTLTGHSLHVSIAAGYFHSLLLQHWRRTGEGHEPVTAKPIDGPTIAPDNAR